jgi:hypothetical protein
MHFSVACSENAPPADPLPAVQGDAFTTSHSGQLGFDHACSNNSVEVHLQSDDCRVKSLKMSLHRHVFRAGILWLIWLMVLYPSLTLGPERGLKAKARGV